MSPEVWIMKRHDWSRGTLSAAAGEGKGTAATSILGHFCLFGLVVGKVRFIVVPGL